MVKKTFGISPSVKKALNQTIQMAEAENSNFVNTEILMDRISLDPDNPRKHKLSLDDLPNGPSNSDPQYEAKSIEFQGLYELSQSISKDGLLHPIVVVENGSDYKVVAGERRFLASLLAKKKVIDARVFKEQPNDLDLKVVQWSENQSRKSLSLYDRLMNIKAVKDAYQSRHDHKLTAIHLSQILSMSRQTAQYYLAILSNTLLMAQIKNGAITSFRIARNLTHAESKEEILATNLVESAQQTKVVKTKTRAVRVNLGLTQNTQVAKTIANAVLNLDQYKKHSNLFNSTDWNNTVEATKAFKKLIKILESEA